MEIDEEAGIARLTFNRPEQRNAYDPAMRQQLAAYLDRAAADDTVKVVILRGAGGVFSAGADMANAYSWYGDETAAGGDRASRGGRSRPSQRRRLTVDRATFGFYHN